jgi:hypothetical protein
MLLQVRLRSARIARGDAVAAGDGQRRGIRERIEAAIEAFTDAP